MISIGYNWKDRTILIAEDAESNYLFLEAALKYTQAKVLWARNGLSAIEICKNQSPDLVLMDIQMPVMSGYEATKRIKEMKPHIPIIAQTAFAMENDKERILSIGCDEYISKPLKLEILLSMIDKYFNKE
jgi:two-component system, cell cycle response regulator DivK